MQVIRQDDRCGDGIRHATCGLFPCFAQRFYVTDQQVAPAVSQRTGEEVRCACNPIVAIRSPPARGQVDNEFASLISSAALCAYGALMRNDEFVDERQAYSKTAAMQRQGSYLLHK